MCRVLASTCLLQPGFSFCSSHTSLSTPNGLQVPNERHAPSSLRLKHVSNTREQPQEAIVTRVLSFIAYGGWSFSFSEPFTLSCRLLSISPTKVIAKHQGHHPEYEKEGK